MKKFKDFFTEKRLKLYRAGSMDVGIIWLATDKKLSAEYGAEHDIEVKEYSVNVKNSLPIRRAGLERTMEEFVLSIINYADSEKINITPVIELAKRMIKIKTGKKKLFELWDKYYTDLKELLTGLGYDSIETKEGNVITYGVFDKKKVKEL